MYIHTQELLSEFCEHAVHEHVIALDTEFIREKTYHPKLCLVQVATKERIAIVDPLVLGDLTPLTTILENPEITKVIHACSQDMEVLLDGLGCEVHPVFDTQIAAAFVGLRQQVSYAALVEYYTGVHLPKTESLTDWSKRPLDEEQLRYAEDDVRYLIGIYERMMFELASRNRLSWVLPEMEAHTDVELARRRPEEAYLRLRRSASLTRRQLAVAREVCAWRERLAAKRDVPRKWVLSDEMIVEVCRRMPQDMVRLRRIRGLEQLAERDAEGIIRAVKCGLDVPTDLCPRTKQRTKPSADVEGVVDLMYALVRLVAEKEGVAVQLIASRDDLADFAHGASESILASGWRHELVGSQLERLLSGELGLTVKNGRIETL